MCEYCEKKSFHSQPFFTGFPELHDKCDGEIMSNLWSSEIPKPDWKVKIYNYKTKCPEMLITSETVGKTLFGDGSANIHIPIKFCPFCGEKLGK